MRVELLRTAGDIYINGSPVIFAVDFKSSTNTGFANVDWLMTWAKIGLASCGYDVPHSGVRKFSEHPILAAIPPTREAQPQEDQTEEAQLQEEGSLVK